MDQQNVLFPASIPHVKQIIWNILMKYIRLITAGCLNFIYHVDIRYVKPKLSKPKSCAEAPPIRIYGLCMAASYCFYIRNHMASLNQRCKNVLIFRKYPTFVTIQNFTSPPGLSTIKQSELVTVHHVCQPLFLCFSFKVRNLTDTLQKCPRLDQLH